MANCLAAHMANLSVSSGPARALKSYQGLRAGHTCHTIRVSSHIQATRQRTPLHIKCARVAGVDIPNQKYIEFSLQYIYGIGHTTSKAILAATNVENKRTKDLTEEELTTLREEVDKYQTEGDLRRFNSLNIKRLKEIQCYRGRRHIAGLPVRGQRTKTNARTRKGKAVAIAGKKKATR